MTEPTPEQIEAATAAMQAESAGFFSAESWRHLARAALVAAAGAAPQEQSGDRAMQIAEHLAKQHTFTLAGGEAIACAALELAAPVQVDEAKLADLAYFALRDTGEGRTVAENLSRKIARVQTEALRGGEPL